MELLETSPETSPKAPKPTLQNAVRIGSRRAGLESFWRRLPKASNLTLRTSSGPHPDSDLERVRKSTFERPRKSSSRRRLGSLKPGQKLRTRKQLWSRVRAQSKDAIADPYQICAGPSGRRASYASSPPDRASDGRSRSDLTFEARRYDPCRSDRRHIIRLGQMLCLT